MKKTLLAAKISLILYLVLFPQLSRGAIDFDFVDDYVSVANFTVPPEGTFAMWLSTDINENQTYGSYPFIFDTSATTTRVYFHGGNKAYTLGTNGLTTGRATWTPGADVVGWWHLIVTWSANGSQFYKNGRAVGVTGVGDHSGNAGSTFYLGTRPFDRWFDGRFAEVAIWDVALTAGEARQLSNPRIRGIPLQVRLANLKLYWPMNDQPIGTSADGDAIGDLSGNGNNGTGNDGANNTGLTWDWDSWINISKVFIRNIRLIIRNARVIIR